MRMIQIQRLLLSLATLAALSSSASALQGLQAHFTAQPTSGHPPLAVSFTDTSTGSPTSWEWSFGDGSTSNEPEPEHTYDAGTYTVTLKVTDAGGGSNSITKINHIVATYVTSQPDALFVPPGHRVPLSEFVKAPGGIPVTLYVGDEIADYVQQNNGVFKMWVDGALHPEKDVMIQGTPVPGMTPLTSVIAPQQGRKCVIVSSSLLQDLPIVTHWRNPAGTPGDRGGQVIGATDGLVTLDYVPGESALDDSVKENLGAPGFAPDPDGPGGPRVSPGEYYYATTTHALFDDGSGLPQIQNAVVPEYEVYIGENYSTYAITDLAAIWLSDQCRARTGYPIRHLSYRSSGTSLSSLPADGLPIFQFIHGYIVDPHEKPFHGQPYHAKYRDSDTDPLHNDPTGEPLEIPGNEQSLASFILPPGWSATAPPVLQDAGTDITGYPGLFIGDYDLNGSMFGGGAWWRLLEPIAKLHRGSAIHPAARQVVGILWNGGGTFVTMTHQESSYYNAAQLILDAQEELKVYAEGMVFTGHSRSGGTAFQLASNPYGLPYKAKYVKVGAAKTLLGDHFLRFCNPSYPGALTNMAGATGYVESWRETWVDGNGVSGRYLVLRNITGSYTQTEADDWSLNSDNLLGDPADPDPLRTGGLLHQGTRVVYTPATHDSILPFEHVSNYINHMRIKGIPLQCHIYFRFGHNVPWKAPHESQHDNDDLLNFVFDELAGNTVSFPELIQGFRRATEGEIQVGFKGPFALVDGSLAPQPNEREVPIVFELPFETGWDQERTWSIVGPPGAHVQVRAEMMDEGWNHDSVCSCATPSGCPTLPFALQPVWTFMLPMLGAGEDPDKVLFKSLTVVRPIGNPTPPNSDHQFYRYVVAYHRIANEPNPHNWNITIGDECSIIAPYSVSPLDCLMRPNAVAPPGMGFMDFEIRTEREVLPGGTGLGVENRTNGVSSDDPSYP